MALSKQLQLKWNSDLAFFFWFGLGQVLALIQVPWRLSGGTALALFLALSLGLGLELSCCAALPKYDVIEWTILLRSAQAALAASSITPVPTNFRKCLHCRSATAITAVLVHSGRFLEKLYVCIAAFA